MGEESRERRKWWSGCCNKEWAQHLGPELFGDDPLDLLTVEFVTLGGWLVVQW